MYGRQESEYFRAKFKAARRLCGGWVKPHDLPTNSEIRDQIQTFARLHEGDRRTENLREMRVEALRLMRILAAIPPATDRQHAHRPCSPRLRYRPACVFR